MKVSIIAITALAAAAAASAVEPAGLGARLDHADPVKRADATVDVDTSTQLNQILKGFEFATGNAKDLSKRQFEVCPLDVCQDRCNFTPPFCFGEFCDWNTLGCLAGCCVACGGC